MSPETIDLGDGCVLERSRVSDAEEVRALAREGLEPQTTWVAGGSVDELSARVRWSEENRHLFAP